MESRRLTTGEIQEIRSLVHASKKSTETKRAQAVLSLDRMAKEILEQIRTIYPKQKIALLRDNAGWHKGSVAQEFLQQDGNFEIIHFPRYAPEENPQEHVWKSGRSTVSHNRVIQDIDGATDELIEYFNKTKFRYSLLGLSPIS